MTIIFYLVPSNTCHQCLCCTWYDTCLLYTSPTTKKQTHLRIPRLLCARQSFVLTQTRQHHHHHNRNHHRHTAPAAQQQHRNQRIWCFMRPEITIIPTSQNWDYFYTFAHYLVPNITCHQCLCCTWYDTCLLHTSPITYNIETNTPTIAYRACCVRDKASSSHTRNSSSTSTIKTTTGTPHQQHNSSTAAAQQQHSSRDSSRGRGELTSPGTVYVPDFKNIGKRQNKTYQFKTNPL